ncbi:unnamed protein product [Dovyalis caffra]|uniref:Uncharacterized protein n=1 Tax=Dovyalis caffra TaxID=77055 RepID=A0AAV1R7F1_9ROSI|nr:unnamed protein product [Dovyalis caffra]
MKMCTSKKLKFLYLDLLSLTLNFFFTTSLCQDTSTSFCGKIQMQTPFLSSNSTATVPLNHMILCRSQKLYFRTSLGLFPVSSIDYASKTLTISHPSCSSSRHYISPSLLSAGFPIPPQPNSLLLFNCSNSKSPKSSFMLNCSHLNPCAASAKTQGQKLEAPYSCLLVDDLEKLDKAFHPKDLNCSHYSQVYRRSLNDDDYKGYELGTRISFDIPDHAPDICSECQKSNGNCGVGLKCICHPEDCKDKVISMAGSTKPISNVLLSVLSFFVVLVSFFNS